MTVVFCKSPDTGDFDRLEAQTVIHHAPHGPSSETAVTVLAASSMACSADSGSARISGNLNLNSPVSITVPVTVAQSRRRFLDGRRHIQD